MSSPAARGVRVRAHAKINLALRVLGIRNDGYHELRTTFQTLALHDTLTFTMVRGPFAIECNDPRCPTDATNLVWKAAELLSSAAGRRGSLSGTRVAIRKRIPTEAGLGGGSSDAAAALRALAVLWRLRLPAPEVARIARELGADVAFFLEGGTALGLERGDLLFPLLDVPRSWVVIARPDFGVSTRDAYAWWDQAFRRRPRGRSAGPGGGRSGEQVNDLEPPVTARHPEISRLISCLRADGASRAAMSGSGSAVFGLFEQRMDAARAARRLARVCGDAWITRTLSRRAYRRSSEVQALDR